jgi:hypothetical protein
MQAVQWIIAAVTATFVAVVAFLQWRTAQQKAVLDLFDRRRAIYEIVRTAVATMVGNSNAFDQAREIEFMQAMENAYFFFGDDVVAYLGRLWTAMGVVRDADKEMKERTVLASLEATIEQRRKALNQIGNFHSEGKPLFAKYMRFSQTVPTPLGVPRRK